MSESETFQTIHILFQKSSIEIAILFMSRRFMCKNPVNRDGHMNNEKKTDGHQVMGKRSSLWPPFFFGGPQKKKRTIKSYGSAARQSVNDIKADEIF